MTRFRCRMTAHFDFAARLKYDRDKSPMRNLFLQAQHKPLAFFGCRSRVLTPTGLLLALTVLVGGALAGCSSNSDGGSGGSSGAAGAATDTSVPECVSAVFHDTTALGCGSPVGCHAQDNDASHLDLGSPNVASRLIGVAAKHTGYAGCTTTDTLVVAGDAANSYMVKKLMNQQGDACGLQMPFATSPRPTDLTCIQDWINGL